ncbi:ABC transporter ATP-binding protein [Weeksellaceae bacterium KMM 9713]|uniref:ABC transporter ATP-binding protein n=1 Tax=Profundicola chukchiensis TaxID=2961959 RepID=A0A9X4MU81_9FLAO|nr:ABC transporter ATP-binding protein [Profundicola chukchiensis]MDG4945006.1 ABC transporter ATP-binding protein [Profundicola chukchiensis]MDG4950086.1 ABC transporter ATP-binding protein [Profundicola chukchiensis]
MDNNNLLVAQNISKSFGSKVALNDFSLSIPKGTIYGLLGPNGAGKTTFIRIINQITMPDTGKVFLNGEPLHPKHISKIGYMPEERGLYKNMKVGEQVVYLAQLKGLSHAEAVKKLKFWFDKLDIGDWWNKKLSELSKGMGQKIQFIVTVLHEPELLIFDEPFSGFDPVNANLIRDEIIELKDKGATIIFSTHRMESVEEMCDHVALINKSNKVLDGPIREIRNQFKEGKFKVELEINNQLAMDSLSNSYEIRDLQTHHGMTSFYVLSHDHNNNNLLNQLTQVGNVREFAEEIPTMNDVFINAVK